MSIHRIHKIGSLVLSFVIAVLVIKIFWGQSLIVSGLCILAGLGTGLMISKKRQEGK